MTGALDFLRHARECGIAARAIQVAISAARQMDHGDYWHALNAACTGIAANLDRCDTPSGAQINALHAARPRWGWISPDAGRADAWRLYRITLAAARRHPGAARAAASLASDIAERLTQQREEARRSGPTAYAEARPIAREAGRAAHTAALTEILGETND